MKYKRTPIWSNRLYYIGGANSNARWCGECRCGFSTGERFFDQAEALLRAHIVSPACKLREIEGVK
jgi:hypothetical protein